MDSEVEIRVVACPEPLELVPSHGESNPTLLRSALT